MEQGLKLPQIRSLEAQGWKVQHSQWSFDSLAVYFSAQAPGAGSYDLYMLSSDGWRWGDPQRLDGLSTEQDEWWPSVSSDEATIYFVRRTPAVSSDKSSYERTQVFRGWQNNGKWGNATPIIISGDEDTRPSIAEDNRTLTFYRRAASKRHDGAWQLMKTEMMDEHNWTLPDTCSAAPSPKPIEVLSGTVTQSINGRPLKTGRVCIYDAITQQLLQTARVHGATGRFRVALQRGEQYRLDVTADGYSHHYIERDERQLSARTPNEVGVVPLSEKLHIRIQLYDEETQENLGGEEQHLTLGAVYPITLRRSGYRDTTLVLNTERQVLFSETEIDVPLAPKKSRHRIYVTDSKTDQPVPEAVVRLDGRVAGLDTTLRLERTIAMQVSATGYFFFDTLLNTGADERERYVRVRLQPIEKDFVLQLRAIQFATDSYELTEDSNTQLEQLLHLMQSNPTLRIELSAHTDDRGTDKYNDRLSALRGDAVAQWLTERGVAQSRIEAKGYGKRKPLVPNDSDENRALNRRVEIKVIDF